MALTRLQLKNFVLRQAKVLASDTVATAGITDDLNFAIEIIAAKREWPQLKTINTITTGATDGDIAYSLASDVDDVEQLRITSPQSYSRELKPVDKEYMRRLIPNKTLAGRAVPSRWYLVEPVIDSTNIETKQVTFDYRPDQAYTVTYSYTRFAPTLDSDGSYPFFDPSYHLYPALFAVWKYAERVKQPALDPIYWRGEWENGIATIEEDEQGQLTHLLQIPGPDQG